MSRVPMRPPTRWTPTTSRLSSKPNRNFRPTARAHPAPATRPTMRAPIGETVAQAGVMRDQAGDDARGGAERGRVAVTQLLHEQPAEHRRAGGGQGVDPDACGLGAGAEGRARVEAEPAEPQDARADHDQRQVVRTHGLLGEPDALAEHQRQGQAGRTGVDVDRGSTGEVVGTGTAEEQAACLVGDPAARLGGVAAEGEHPVGRREVDEGRPDDGEDGPGAELGAVGDGAGDQGHRDDREDDLERHEGRPGYAARCGGGLGGRDEAVDGVQDSLEPEVGERVADRGRRPRRARRPRCSPRGSRQCRPCPW